MSGERRELATTAVVAVSWGLVVAVGAYAVVRAVQSFRLPDANPAALVWSPHAGFFWRIWTVVYVGGFAAFAAFVVAQGRLAAVARALAPAVAIAATLLALQSLLLP